MIKERVGLLILSMALGLGMQFNTQAANPSAGHLLSKAHQALFQTNLKAVEQAYQEAYQSATLAEHKLKAAAGMGTLAWRYRKDFALAEDWFTKPGKDIPKLTGSSKFFRAQARFLAEEMNYESALAKLKLAYEHCTTDGCRLNTLKERAQIIVDAGADLSTEGRSLLTQLQLELATQPFDFELADRLMALSLNVGDYQSFFAAFNAYLASSSTEGLSESIQDARTILAELETTSLPKVNESYRDRLIMGLGKARLYHLINILPEDYAQSEQSKRYLAYAKFTKKLEQSVAEHNRQIAVGEVEDDLLYKIFGQAIGGLLTDLGDEFDAPMTEEQMDAIKPRLEKEFGLHYVLGNTGGTISLHYGHAYIDDTRTMTQYGNTVEYRYTSLMHMLSNGYQSWFWDGMASAGGWATATQVYRVRSGYVPSTSEWELLNSDAKRSEFLTELKEAEVNDATIADDANVKHLKSVSMKLKMKALEQLPKETDRIKFVNDFSQLMLVNDIFIHESRHAIDHTNGMIPGKTNPAADLEYTAKLSELGLGPAPMLALSRVMAGNMGDGTGHGDANQKVIEGFVAWMNDNPSKLKNIDVQSPMLIQLANLNDDEIRMIARALDPLVSKEG